MHRINQWMKNAVGRRMDVDGAYGLQCKDVADDYCVWLFGNWIHTIRPANAKDAFHNANPEYFHKIANNLNDPNLIPQRGDIIIWGAMRGNPYGHIAVVESADTGGVNVIEQDGYLQIPARRFRRGYIVAGGPCIGWLRPKAEKIIGYQPPAQLAKTERKMEEDGNARHEPNTSSGIFQELKRGDTVNMKGYVTNGQSIAGDTVWYVTARSGKYMSRQLFHDKDLHDLPDLTPKPAPKPAPQPEEDFSGVIIDVSNHQTADVVNIFPKVAGVIVKAGWVGQSLGGDANKLDPDAELFVGKAREAGKLLGLYWHPYFSTNEEAAQNATYFAACIDKLGNREGELLFIDLEPDFEGTKEQVELFKDIVQKKTGKQVLVYAGNAIAQKLGLERVDWYPNYGQKGNYQLGSFIHQYSETGKISGYGGNLDLNISTKSVDELRKLGAIIKSEEPEPEPEPLQPHPDRIIAEVFDRLKEKPAPRPFIAGMKEVMRIFISAMWDVIKKVFKK